MPKELERKLMKPNHIAYDDLTHKERLLCEWLDEEKD